MASSGKKERLLFELRFKEVGLLQQALKIMVLAAACPDGLSLAGTGRNEDSGDLHILSGEVFLVVKTIISPDVDACLALKPFATFVVPAGLVLCLDLRLLEKEMNDTAIGGNVEGLTLCLRGEKLGEIVCSLIKENDNVVRSSVIPVISTRFGADQIRSYWNGLENSFVLSFQFSVQSLNQVMGYNGSPVHITVTQNAVLIEVGDDIRWLREKVGEFIIVHRSQEYPLTMQFTNFHPRDAIMNAVALSEILMFHLTSDSRCVLEIFVNGVASIHFCFNAN